MNGHIIIIILFFSLLCIDLLRGELFEVICVL